MLTLKPKLTQERLMQVLFYEPETGDWFWRHNGKIAGTPFNGGYNQIMIDTSKYMASHLAFLYMTGHMPKDTADHKDRNPANDTWTNLREATQAEQNRNRIRRYKNQAGFTGVKREPSGRYRAHIKISGKTIHLGMFDKAEDAAEAYKKAAIHYYGEFASA